jgi:hypothetical protein
MTATSENGTDASASSATTAPDGRAAAIARLAYEKWTARGRPVGDDQRDWYEAEQEVLAGAPQPSASPPARSRKRA